MAGQGREKRGGEKQEKGVANNILTDCIYNDAKRDVLVTAGVRAGRQAGVLGLRAVRCRWGRGHGL